MGKIFEAPVDVAGVKQRGDVLGGSGPLDSGIYNCLIEHAYTGVSQGGAKSLTLRLKTVDGRFIRETLWMTSGTAKGCLPYFTDKDGVKQLLPGYELASNLCLLAAGKDISQVTTEKKTVKVYDYEAKGEVAREVDMIMALIGKPISVGLINQIVDKRARQDDGTYAATGETRSENVIEKFFRAKDGLTVTEIKSGAAEADFKVRWAKQWEDQVRDRSTNNAGSAGMPGAVMHSTAPAVNAANLFA